MKTEELVVNWSALRLLAREPRWACERVILDSAPCRYDRAAGAECIPGAAVVVRAEVGATRSGRERRAKSAGRVSRCWNSGFRLASGRGDAMRSLRIIRKRSEYRSGPSDGSG
jgi:hypothetical protein